VQDSQADAPRYIRQRRPFTVQPTLQSIEGACLVPRAIAQFMRNAHVSAAAATMKTKFDASLRHGLAVSRTIPRSPHPPPDRHPPFQTASACWSCGGGRRRSGTAPLSRSSQSSSADLPTLVTPQKPSVHAYPREHRPSRARLVEAPQRLTPRPPEGRPCTSEAAAAAVDRRRGPIGWTSRGEPPTLGGLAADTFCRQLWGGWDLGSGSRTSC